MLEVANVLVLCSAETVPLIAESLSAAVVSSVTLSHWFLLYASDIFGAVCQLPPVFLKQFCTWLSPSSEAVSYEFGVH